jgi:hypothetical protein
VTQSLYIGTELRTRILKFFPPPVAELRLECGAGVLAVELALFRPASSHQRLNCSEIGTYVDALNLIH